MEELLFDLCSTNSLPAEKSILFYDVCLLYGLDVHDALGGLDNSCYTHESRVTM